MLYVPEFVRDFLSPEGVRHILYHIPGAEYYCTDGYCGYLDAVHSGKHIYNIHNIHDTFTVEGVNAGLRHYIAAPARRGDVFPGS